MGGKAAGWRLAALLLVAAVAWGGPDEVQHAWDLVMQGRRGEAITLLRGLTQAEPGNVEAHLLLGSLLQDAGEREECLKQLTAAVSLRPDSAEAQNALGEAYNAFGESKSARGRFEKAVKLDGKFAAARVNLGALLLSAGETEAAAKQLDAAIGLLGEKEDAAYPLYLRAKIYAQGGEAAKAEGALVRAVKIQPGFAEAWSDLGAVRQAMRDSGGAMAALRRAVELKPGDAVAQRRLGMEYLDEGKAEQAVAHLRAAARVSPNDQSVLNGLQRALRETGRDAEADRVKAQLVEMLRARDRADQNTVAALRLNNEGAELEKAGNLAGAIEKYRAAHQLAPEHNGIQVNLAVALLRNGAWEEGLKLLREASARQPDDAALKAALEDALDQAPVRYGGRGKARKAPGAGK
jgi:Flp pilus assembly protein TadD